MAPPEGFDLPISRTEGDADASRGHTRTQPRARVCRVAPPRSADADFREDDEKRKRGSAFSHFQVLHGVFFARDT